MSCELSLSLSHVRDKKKYREKIQPAIMAKTSSIWGQVLFFLLYLPLYFGRAKNNNTEQKVLEITGLRLFKNKGTFSFVVGSTIRQNRHNGDSFLSK